MEKNDIEKEISCPCKDICPSCLNLSLKYELWACPCKNICPICKLTPKISNPSTEDKMISFTTRPFIK